MILKKIINERKLHENQLNSKKNIIFVLFLVVCILENTQFILGLGSLDIDDVIEPSGGEKQYAHSKGKSIGY